MRTLRSCLGLLGTLALAGPPSPAGAQPAGSEFQVNTYTTSNQGTASFGGHLAAADASGNFVVVWSSCCQDGDFYGVFGQRYDRDGVARGTEFSVNSFTSGAQYTPSVASDAGGNFIVVWEGTGQDDGLGIFGQRFDSAGVAQGDEFRVNSYTTSSQRGASVASDASGNFVVVWAASDHDGSGYGVFGQRYDSAGGTLGGEFLVNSFTTASQRFPSVASDASGNFVVVWSSGSQDGSGYGIFGQRYDAVGAAQGGEFRVSSYTTDNQQWASVASAAGGSFVVVWESRSQDGSGSGIFGQRYDSAGVALGDEFRVNSFTTGTQRVPSVASDAGGSFVAVWSSLQDGSDYGVFGQRYDSEGAAQGGEFQINSHTTDVQWFPSVGAMDTDRFVVVWESAGDQDGSGTGVFGQLLDSGGLPSLSIADVVVREGNPLGESKRTPARFTVSLSAPSPQTVTVQYSTADGTATAPSDYKASSGTLTFDPGQTSRSIVIAVRKDIVPESDETFFVNLANPTNATIADGQALGTIRNDDQLARVAR